MVEVIASEVCMSNFDNSMMLQSFESSCSLIENRLVDIAVKHLEIAFYIYIIDHSKQYLVAGYDNIVDAMFSRFGFRKSTVYNFIGIAEKFGRNDKGIVTLTKLKSYQLFSYSQLCEMLSMTSCQLDLVTPDISVKAMRDLKKADKVQTSGKSETAPEVVEMSGQPLESARQVCTSANLIKYDIPLNKWRSFSHMKKHNLFIDFIHRHGLLEEFFKSVSDDVID